MASSEELTFTLKQLVSSISAAMAIGAVVAMIYSHDKQIESNSEQLSTTALQINALTINVDNLTEAVEKIEER